MTSTTDASLQADRARLASRVETFIGNDEGDEAFDALARDIFAYQVRANQPYANYCRELGGGAIATPRTWRDIPALPAGAFRNREHPPACFPVAEAAATFETSGTTGDATGRHHLFSTSLYEQSILAGWRHASLPELESAILTPSASDAPRSSLSFMMETLAHTFGSATGSSPFLVDARGDIDLARLRACAAGNEPILLLGTALAFLHLFKLLGTGRLELPPGSTAMETGGYKGTAHSLAKPQLYALFEKHLGLPAERIINEYGMTELSSQFYTNGLGQPHRGGPWTRVSIIDPETGSPAASGAPGTLTITDLANLDSCIRVATRDLGRRDDPGDDAFTLLGRDPAALARGCSRSADELLQ